MKLGGNSTNSPELLLLKNAINLLSQPFLGRHLGFHIFFHHSVLGAVPFFYSLVVFDWIGLYRHVLCDSL